MALPKQGMFLVLGRANQRRLQQALAGSKESLGETTNRRKIKDLHNQRRDLQGLARYLLYVY